MAGTPPRRSARARPTRTVRNGSRKPSVYSDDSGDTASTTHQDSITDATDRQVSGKVSITAEDDIDIDEYVPIKSRRSAATNSCTSQENIHPDELINNDPSNEQEIIMQDQEDVEEEEFGVSITRCICGKGAEDESLGFMIQCESCDAWQHGNCMGFPSVKYCPDKYYCEKCRPDLHPPNISRKRPKHPIAPIQTDIKTSSTTKGSSSTNSTNSYHNNLPKRGRSTMNSRDAAYDEFVKTGIMSPTTAQSFFEEDERDRQNNAIAARKRHRRSISNREDDGEHSINSQSPKHEQGIESDEENKRAIGGVRKRKRGGPWNNNVMSTNGNRRTTRRSQATGGSSATAQSEDDNGNNSGDEAGGYIQDHSNSGGMVNTFVNGTRTRRRVNGRGAATSNMDIADDTASNVDSIDGHHFGSPRPNGVRKLGSTPRKSGIHHHGTRGNGSRGGTPSPSDEQSKDEPVRIRYPNKRMTLPEMRRRASNMLDFIGRVQIEMAEKESVETKSLSPGVVYEESSNISEKELIVKDRGDFKMDIISDISPNQTEKDLIGDVKNDKDIMDIIEKEKDLTISDIKIEQDIIDDVKREEVNENSITEPNPKGLQNLDVDGENLNAVELMDRLSRELILFQDKYGKNALSMSKKRSYDVSDVASEAHAPVITA